MTFFPTGQGLMGGLRNAGGFIFGEGTDAPTYDALKRKREIANLLMAQTMQQPVNNWGDGVGKVLSALGARMMDRRLAGQEKADQDAAGGRLQEIISALGGGGGMGLAGMSSSGGGAMPPRDPGTAPAGYALPSADPDWDSIRAGIFAGESGGDYNALFGYSNRPGGRFQDFKLTDMTVDDAIRFSDPGGAYGQWVKGQVGRVATPMGAYQVVGTTLRGAKEGLGLTGEERMTPEVQDAIGRWIYQTQGTGAWEGYRGPRDPASISTMGGGGGYQQPGFDPGMAMELGELIPRLPEGQRAVAEALLAQSLSQGTPMTPYQQESLALDRDRLAFDREKFASGTREGPKYYGNVQWAGDPDTGEYRPYQIGSDGTVNWIDLGGAQPMPPTRSADLGTSIAQVGPGGVTTGAVLEKDVRGEAGERAIGTAQGESVGGAAAGLAGATAKAEQSMALIDSIIADPALEGITGMIEGRLPPMTQAGTDLNVKIDQLRGRVFTEAFESLKGGGAITEAEGRAATEAMGRINRAQSVGEFQTALAELRGIISAGVERMRQKAAQAAPEAPAAAPDWMTQTDPTTWSEEQMLEAERHWGLR